MNKFSGGSPPSMYMAIIDDVDFYPMDITSLPITTIPYGTTGFGPEEFGTPIPSHPGPDSVLSSIAIETNVRISGNDTVVLVATFVGRTGAGTGHAEPTGHRSVGTSLLRLATEEVSLGTI